MENMNWVVAQADVDGDTELVTTFETVQQFATYGEAHAWAKNDVGNDPTVYEEDWVLESGNMVHELNDGNGKDYCVYHVNDEEAAKDFMQRNF